MLLPGQSNSPAEPQTWVAEVSHATLYLLIVPGPNPPFAANWNPFVVYQTSGSRAEVTEMVEGGTESVTATAAVERADSFPASSTADT